MSILVMNAHAEDCASLVKAGRYSQATNNVNALGSLNCAMIIAGANISQLRLNYFTGKIKETKSGTASTL